MTKRFFTLEVGFLAPYPDFVALAITFLLTIILSIGVKESTRFNNVFTCLNLVVVLLVVGLGIWKIDLRNWDLPANPSENRAGGKEFASFISSRFIN